MSPGAPELRAYVASLNELVSLLENGTRNTEALRAAFRRSEESLAALDGLDPTGSSGVEQEEIERLLENAARILAVSTDLVLERGLRVGEELSIAREARKRLDGRGEAEGGTGRRCDLAG